MPSFDTRSGPWSPGPPLPVACFNHSTVALGGTQRHALSVFAIGGRLYAVGGCVTP